jgi:hypothetical protein
LAFAAFVEELIEGREMPAFRRPVCPQF